jgi:hypothetical protein
MFQVVEESMVEFVRRLAFMVSAPADLHCA